MRLLSFIATLVVASGWLYLQTDEDFVDPEQYRESMGEINHSFAELAEKRRSQRTDEIAEEAGRLAELFGRVEKFWKARGDEEAANFARMAKEGCESLRSAAINGDPQAMDASIETIARACEGCHTDPLDRYRLPR